jgi:hypothetical protein
VILSLADGLIVGPDGQRQLPESDDPKLNDFRRLTTAGAIINEILSREAGRPLRRLEEQEALAVAQESSALFEKLNSDELRAAGQTPNVFSTCAQRDLLSGAAVACCFSPEGAREKLPRDLLTLRILVEGLHQACGGEPATSPRSWDSERLRLALATQGDPLRREALAACDTHRAELLPDLLSELEWWATEPKAALEEDGSLGMHALFLLAKWREAPAWPAFRKLLSLPGEISYELLGDTITEDGPVLLAMVGSNQRDELLTMIEDERLDQFCRAACLDALTCLVAWGELPRAEYVAYLRELLTARLRGVAENEHVFATVVSAACDLEAWELRPEIEAAYARRVVDECFIDLDYFLRAADGKRRGEWQLFCDRHQPIVDVANATSWLDDPPPEDEPPLPRAEDVKVIADSVAPYLAPPKVGRNELCPCGSGKKYKKCCGR